MDEYTLNEKKYATLMGMLQNLVEWARDGEVDVVIEALPDQVRQLSKNVAAVCKINGEAELTRWGWQE